MAQTYWECHTLTSESVREILGGLFVWLLNLLWAVTSWIDMGGVCVSRRTDGLRACSSSRVGALGERGTTATRFGWGLGR